MTDSRSAVPFAAWLVVAAGGCAALHVGKLPPAIPVLQAQIGLTLPQAGFLLSFVQLAGMSLGLLVGLMADRWGLRRSILVGLALLATGSLVGARTVSVPLLLGLRGLEGLGLLLVALPAPALIRRLVPLQQIAAMLGVWGAYMPIGTAAALLLGPTVIGAGGWPVWWSGLGLAAIGLFVAVWIGVPADPSFPRVCQYPEARSEATVVSVGERLRLTLASPVPWLLAACFAVYSSQWLAVIGFLPKMYGDSAVSPALVAPLTALAAGINLTGNIAAGRLLTAGYTPQMILWAGYGGLAFGAWTAFSDTLAAPFGLRFMGVCLFSAVGGLVPGTLFTLAVRLAPRADTVSTTVGWMQQWSSAGQFLGPPAVALLAGRQGSWGQTWIVTGTCSFIGCLLVWWLLCRIPSNHHRTQD